MTMMYATITSKGQITLPVELRRELGLHEGQRVLVRSEGGSLIIDPPVDLETVRQLLRAKAEAAGTWGLETRSGDGWAAYVEQEYVNGIRRDDT